MESFWPLFFSSSVLFLVFTFLYYLKFLFITYFLFVFFFLSVLLYLWLSDLNFEGNFGMFTSRIYSLFRFGFILFICSEVLFFFGFFWCFFTNCFSLNLFFSDWVPYDFKFIIVDVFSYPLLKTVLLLSSGVSLTVIHYGILISNRYYLAFSYFSDNTNLFNNFYINFINYGYYLTILLGFMFLYFQFFEYYTSNVSINRTVYGNIFFVLTGFHGFHVFVGLVMLIVSLFRYLNLDYSREDHSGFECAAWYWHFVDVVWLFLYLFVYWYGS